MLVHQSNMLPRGAEHMRLTLGVIVNISRTFSVFNLRSSSVMGAFIVLVEARPAVPLPAETEVFDVGAEFLEESLLASLDTPLDPLLVLVSLGPDPSLPRLDPGKGTGCGEGDGPNEFGPEGAPLKSLGARELGVGEGIGWEGFGTGRAPGAAEDFRGGGETDDEGASALLLLFAGAGVTGGTEEVRGGVSSSPTWMTTVTRPFPAVLTVDRWLPLRAYGRIFQAEYSSVVWYRVFCSILVG